MNTPAILAEWERAKESLGAARSCLRDGYLRDAVSRCYYTMMHAAKAALLVHDVSAESHAAVRRLFGKVLVRSGELEKEWSQILAKEQAGRGAADYDVFTSWEVDRAQESVQRAEAFLNRIRSYLVDKGVTLSP